MKITITKTVDYFDVDKAFKLKPAALFQLFQNAAITHAETVGYCIDKTITNGDGWVLMKLEMAIYRYPKYKETIKVVTWSRQLRGAQGFREFEIFSGDERLAAASSIYVFVDTKSKKVKRVPKEMSGIYTIEPDVALNPTLNKWTAVDNFHPDITMNVSTRFFDYDPMGHVNNSVFIQFLETAIASALDDHYSQIKVIKIQYHREIGEGIKEIQVGLQKSDSHYQFKVFDMDHVYTCGMLELV